MPFTAGANIAGPAAIGKTAPWIFPRIADRFGRDMPNALEIISRWKIVDNLRRAIYEPVMLALLLSGWLFLPRGPVFWTGAALVVVLLPSFLQLMAGLTKIRRYSAGYLKSLAVGFAIEQVRMALFFALLLHQSVIMIDAAVNGPSSACWLREGTCWSGKPRLKRKVERGAALPG